MPIPHLSAHIKRRISIKFRTGDMQWDFQLNFYFCSLAQIIATLYTMTKITIRIAHVTAHFSHNIVVT